MSMKLITDAVAKLKPSSPVFQLVLTDNNWSGPQLEIEDNPLFPAQNKPDIGDHFHAMACKNFVESFDHRCRVFKVDKEAVTKKMYKEVQGYLRSFLAKNNTSKVKNFEESKKGKWYYRHALNTDKSIPNNGLQNNLVSLYNYLITNANMMVIEEKHIKNGLAVMEAILEKYYNEDDIRQRRRRRRRR